MKAYQLDLFKKRSKNAEAQAAFRARKREKGLVPISGFVHAHQFAKVQLLLKALADHREWDAGPAIDEKRRLVRYDR